MLLAALALPWAAHYVTSTLQHYIVRICIRHSQHSAYTLHVCPNKLLENPDV